MRISSNRLQQRFDREAQDSSPQRNARRQSRPQLTQEFLGKLFGQERAAQIFDRISSRRSERRAQREEREPKLPDKPITPAPEQPAPDSPASPPSDNEIKLEELARLYVEQYQSQSGRTMSEAEVTAKTAEVAEFYGGLSGGRERLDEIVFANDGQSSGLNETA